MCLATFSRPHRATVRSVAAFLTDGWCPLGPISDVALQVVEREQLEAVVDGILDVYAAAFAAPPYSQPLESAAKFGDVLVARHAPREGFRCVVARTDASIVGFGYGTTSRPGNWWHDAISPALPSSLRERWLGDAWALAELAVEPRGQGQGIGSALHTALLERVRHPTAVAQVRCEAPALRFYEKHGWTQLVSGFVRRGGGHPVAIIGLDLEARLTAG